MRTPRMARFKRFIALAAIGMAMAACRADTVPVDETGSGSTGGVTPPTEGVPFTLKVESKYDGTSVRVEEAVCDVPAGTLPGAGAISCDVTIPEGRLYYSSLHLSVSAAADTDCKIVYFQPYYYHASQAAGFTPYWNDFEDVDCTEPDDALCYSGPAVEIVPNFPVNRGVFYLTAKQLGNEFSISSAYEKKRGSNRWTCNTLIDRSNPIALTGDGYVANSMRDYIFQCADEWLQPLYQINLTISDEDEEGPPTDPDPDDPDSNHRADWNSSSGE